MQKRKINIIFSAFDKTQKSMKQLADAFTCLGDIVLKPRSSMALAYFLDVFKFDLSSALDWQLPRSTMTDNFADCFGFASFMKKEIGLILMATIYAIVGTYCQEHKLIVAPQYWALYGSMFTFVIMTILAWQYKSKPG